MVAGLEKVDAVGDQVAAHDVDRAAALDQRLHPIEDGGSLVRVEPLLEVVAVIEGEHDDRVVLHPLDRLEEVAAQEPVEGRQLVLPGPAISALQPLLGAGLRIDGSPAVYCSDGPGPAFERYLPMSFALL